ncbi:MAG: calcium-binding protein [Ruegeria sp.]
MFLFASLLGLAAVGGVAYMVGDEPIVDDDDEVLPDDGEFNTGADESGVDDGTGDEESDVPLPPTIRGLVSDYDGNLVIAGDETSEALAGLDGDDQINGYEGDDTVQGADGNDILQGGEGDDLVQGGEGDDVLHGDDGDDQLQGDTGADSLFGHFGNDHMQGGEGDDELYGGQNDDQLEGGEGDDALHGGHGEDALDGGEGEDTLFGGFGNDVLNGIESASDETPTKDYLNGGQGEDTILAGRNDIVTSGTDADDIVLGDIGEDGDAVSVMDFEPGEDRLLVTWDLDALPDPDVEIQKDPEVANLTRVLIEGHEVAQLYSTDVVTSDDIQLIKEADLPSFQATG